MISLPGRLRSLWSRTPATRSTVVVCPSAKLPAKVEIDPDHRMRGCSRWPEIQNGCVEGCKPQLEFSSEELEEFTNQFVGKPCPSCRATLTAEDWYKSRLSFLDPESAPSRANSEAWKGHATECRAKRD